MGYALALECAIRGAQVTLVSGPVNLKINHPNIKRIDVTTAEEMYVASCEHFKNCDAGIMCAAVADFTPEFTAEQKVKRGKDDLIIKLKPTKDIAAKLGSQKKEGQVLVGFALETYNEENNAALKLKKKNLDFIVLNSLNDPNAGFMHDTNKITIISGKKQAQRFNLKSKQEVASDVVNYLSSYFFR